MKKRQSNFELLRLIVMFLIVFHHSIVHGLFVPGFIDSTKNINEMFMLQIVAIFGKVAVAIFIMITGYFLVNSNFNLKKMISKIIAFLLQIYFYSIGIYLIAIAFKWVQPNLGDLKSALLPLGEGTWWFAVSYILLYLIYPYINILIKNINRQQHKDLIIILAVIFTFLPIIFSEYIDKGYAGDFVLFILFYLIGAYFKLYTIKNDTYEKKLSLITFCSSYLSLGVVLYIARFAYYKTQDSFYDILGQNVCELYSVFLLLIATSIFVYFKHVNIKYNKFINSIAAATFGVYLIHDHPIIRYKLWYDLYKVGDLYNNNSFWHFVLILLIISSLTFVVCLLIDYIRIHLFKLINKIWLKLTNNHSK